MLNKYNICSLVVILFHIVGLIGFLHPQLNALFVKIVPFHLLLMLGLMVISGFDRSSAIVIFAVTVFTLGFLIEVVGVNTGLIFGSYKYGQTLGWKLWETPLLIGVNWLLLVYSAGISLARFRINPYLMALSGAVILVLTDVIIEPVAIQFDYWEWTSGKIPLQNYLGWFFVSFLMFIIFNRLKFKKHNPAAIVLFIAQLCFFIILNRWTT